MGSPTLEGFRGVHYTGFCRWYTDAHGGILLNGAADTVATKRVNNEPSPNGVQHYLAGAGEDTDSTEYEILDREETLNDGIRFSGRTDRNSISCHL
jgi:hypothetical protein